MRLIRGRTLFRFSEHRLATKNQALAANGRLYRATAKATRSIRDDD